MTSQDDACRAAAVVEDDGPLGVAGDVVGIGVLGGCPEGLPGDILVRVVLMGIQHGFDCQGALQTMAVDAIALVGLDLLGVEGVVVGGLPQGRGA